MLRLRTMHGDYGIGQIVAHGRRCDAAVPVREFPDDERRRDEVDTVPLDRLRDGKVQNPEVPGFPDDIEGKGVVLLKVHGAGHDLTADKTAHRFHILLLLFVQIQIHQKMPRSIAFFRPPRGPRTQ